jgi:hypothetical protein
LEQAAREIDIPGDIKGIARIRLGDTYSIRGDGDYRCAVGLVADENILGIARSSDDHIVRSCIGKSIQVTTGEVHETGHYYSIMRFFGGLKHKRFYTV